MLKDLFEINYNSKCLAKDVDFASHVYLTDHCSQNDFRFLVDKVANIPKFQDKITKQLSEQQKLKSFARNYSTNKEIRRGFTNTTFVQEM